MTPHVRQITGLRSDTCHSDLMPELMAERRRDTEAEPTVPLHHPNHNHNSDTMGGGTSRVHPDNGAKETGQYDKDKAGASLNLPLSVARSTILPYSQHTHCAQCTMIFISLCLSNALFLADDLYLFPSHRSCAVFVPLLVCLASRTSFSPSD